MKNISNEKRESIFFSIGLISSLIVGMLSYAYFSTISDYSNVLAALLGAAVALCIPFWQTYIVQKSRLALEVNGISRKISDKAKISLDEHSEFLFIKKNER